MSRRPTSTKLPTMSRAASSASIAMPPPTKVPGRPPSVMSVSTASRQVEEGSESRPSSPKKGGRKTIVNGNVNGNGKSRAEGNESGEINIQVVVRCRGRSSQELASASPIITTTYGPLAKAITVETTPMASSSLATFTTGTSYGSGGPSTKTYPFDKVFGPEADQAMVFGEVAEGMLDEVLAGYNCTIFAYGQTGTGKTYTMKGDLELSPLLAPKDSAGIVPRVLHRLFALLEAGSYSEYSVKCSYVELYNEELRDLLAADYEPVTASQKQPMSMNNGAATGGLKLYEDGKKGVMIQGLEETGVRNLKESLGLLNKGCQRRQVAETKMNTESSRSHTIFTVTVHVKETGVAVGGEDLLRIGKFNLVDLAGSEAIGRSGATDKRAREAGMINQSLLTLGRVISALVEKGSHIPYRESKLTRLLQDSLGGRTKTCIVATVSPTRSNMEETLSTLDYAIRAKSIRNRPELNAHLTKAGLLKEYVGDIERLKIELLAAREKNGIFIPEEQWREMHEQQAKQKSDYEEAKHRANACTVELATKKKMFDELTEKMLATTADLEEAREAERELNELVDLVKEELEVKRIALEEERVVSEAYENGEKRVDGIAVQLKGVAQESVSDVGGLFEKLARKAQVLGSNADSATRFGTDLQSLSTDLRKGLHKLNKVQASFGKELQTGLDGHARRHQEVSQQEVVDLEKSFIAFNGLAKTLSKSIGEGSAEADQASTALLKLKEEVQSSVSQWAQGVSAKSTQMVEELLDHQSEHLSMVTSVLDSTADLVDAVISTARDHLKAESAASARSQNLAEQASQIEIDRLRNQNLLLANLLAEEKAKSVTLRTQLISNLTSMIVGFTDAQDESWSKVVGKVQSENEVGISEMGVFGKEAKGIHAESSKRAGQFSEELDMGGETCSKQREAGQGALVHVRDGMRTRLHGYAEDTVGEAERCGSIVEGYCEQISGHAAGVSSRASLRAQTQSNHLDAISQDVASAHTSSLERLQTGAKEMQNMSQTLLSSQASSSQSYSQYHTATTQVMSTLIDKTAHFLSEEIHEDVPTGITPRKRTWDVPTNWERTEPREAIIAAFRQRQMNGVANSPAVDTMNGNEIVTDSLSTTTSISSLASIEPIQVELPLPPLQPQAVIVNSLSLSTSQLRMPSKSKIAKHGSGGGKMDEREKERERERIVVAPLDENGINIPRRLRK